MAVLSDGFELVLVILSRRKPLRNKAGATRREPRFG